MTPRSIRAWVATWMVAGCTASAPPSSGSATGPVPSETSPPRAEGGASPSSAASPAGTWVSDGCGERAYPRELTLAPGGTFTARDLVSPCPAGKTCVWSGIVARSGTWKLDGARVTLAPEGDDGKKPGAPFATELELGPDSLVEAGSGPPCAYRRR